MNISVTQENISKALSYIAKATANKPNIPVLANVLISVKQGRIKFSGTDLEISVSATIGGDIVEEGEITVNAKLLTEFISKLKSAKIELKQAGNTLEVKSVDNQAQFVIIPAEDFPTLPDTENEADFIIEPKEFAKAINKTVFAAATDQSRPVLTGVLFEVSERNLSIVGVDGFRLSRKRIELVRGPKEDLKIIIPAKSLQELARIILDINLDDEDSLEIFYLKERNQVLFKFGEIIMSSRILEGQFPDYKQIIPSEKQFEFTIARDEFSDAVKIASIFARNVIGNKTLFKVDPEARVLNLSSKVLDIGTNNSSATLDSVSGDEFETAYNARFLSELISIVDGDIINFESNGATSPGVFKDSDDDNFLHIIMPMRIE